MTKSDFFKNLVVHKTIKVSDMQEIIKITKKMADDYVLLQKSNKFSYRILLPRKEKDVSIAKNIGIHIQLEFLSQLKEKKIRVRLREVKYIHDLNYYGWLLLNSELYDTYLDQI
jgi:hypothetical protein